MSDWMFVILPLLIGWLLDVFLGDPMCLPHPVVGFGKLIAFGEHHLNKGRHRKAKGAVMSLVLILLTFVVSSLLLSLLPPLGRVGVGHFLEYEHYSKQQTGGD